MWKTLGARPAPVTKNDWSKGVESSSGQGRSMGQRPLRGVDMPVPKGPCCPFALSGGAPGCCAQGETTSRSHAARANASTSKTTLAESSS